MVSVMWYCTVFICYCEQEHSDDVLTSRTAITDLIECLCGLPYVMADWRCSTAVVKCLLSVMNNSHLCHPGSDPAADFLSSWAMVDLSYLTSSVTAFSVYVMQVPYLSLFIFSELSYVIKLVES